jgi:hypothetical protein
LSEPRDERRAEQSETRRWVAIALYTEESNPKERLRVGNGIVQGLNHDVVKEVVEL